jgi:hypothetical protein
LSFYQIKGRRFEKLQNGTVVVNPLGMSGVYKVEGTELQPLQNGDVVVNPLGFRQGTFEVVSGSSGTELRRVHRAT